MAHRRWYDRIFGHPLVYEYVRPLTVGGLDLTPAYENLGATRDDVVVDVGCGTGDALNYLQEFRGYYGFDTDATAVAYARRKFGHRPGVHFFDRTLTATDLEELQATRVMLAGLLHHLSDAEAVGLLRACGSAPSVQRIATLDVVNLPNQWLSNLLARFDRGTHVRDVEGYERLAREAGLHIARKELIRSYPVTGIAIYLLFALTPAARPQG
jgi:SAM-dependent methyltransferase